MLHVSSSRKYIILKTVLPLVFLLLFCEYFIYYIVLLQCRWPELKDSTLNGSKPLKVVIIADTHLLGPYLGHWFDKLRREWQMYRAFQSMIDIHVPDAVFILGDVFDEGEWADEAQFEAYMKRFHKMFACPKETKLFVVAGNHDMGFHDSIYQYLNDRFEKSFNTNSVRTVVLQGNIFVLVNSMALEGDGCFLCKAATMKLKKLSLALKCAKGTVKGLQCSGLPALPSGTKPILMQHFPLFRDSDRLCNEPDASPNKEYPFREKWECISKQATAQLFSLLDPRLVLDGHTHHSCLTVHPNGVPEWTVASFSWRNKKSPSLLLATISPRDFTISKCFLPQESTVITLYVCGVICWILYIALFVLPIGCLRHIKVQ